MAMPALSLVSPARRAPLGIAVLRLLILLGLLVLWEIAARLAGRSGVIAPPSEIAAAFGPKILGDAKVRAAVLMTFVELGIAFAAAVVSGMLIGMLIGASELGRRGALPIVLMLYAVPQVVLLPLFVLVFGLGPVCKIAFGVSHGIFPVIVNTVAGMREVDRRLMHGATAMGASN